MPALIPLRQLRPAFYSGAESCLSLSQVTNSAPPRSLAIATFAVIISLLRPAPRAYCDSTRSVLRIARRFSVCINTFSPSSRRRPWEGVESLARELPPKAPDPYQNFEPFVFGCGRRPRCDPHEKSSRPHRADLCVDTSRMHGSAGTIALFRR